VRIHELVVLTTALLASARIAAADPASDLSKRGFDQFKAGKYAEATATLSKAYGMDPRPETLFALAQAERLGGDCKAAVEHYHQVLEKVSDLNVGKLVAQALAMCPGAEPPPEPAKPIPAPPVPVALPPPPPKIITKMVTREVEHTDKIAAGLAVAGALALGGAAGLYIAADNNHTAAIHAYTQSDYTTFEDRSNSERSETWIAVGAGAVLIGAATAKWLVRGNDAGTEAVAVVPLSGGGAVSVFGRW
jgi:tetratricopeptide (TPR) repeat protein